VHDFKYLEYLVGLVFLAALCKVQLLFADSNMLAGPKFDYRTLYGTLSGTHSIPHCNYIRIGYFCWRHARRTVNYFVVIPFEYGDMVDVSVVFIGEIFAISPTIANFTECLHFSTYPGMIYSKSLCPYLFVPRLDACVEV
jgi:hypothetical protein